MISLAFSLSPQPFLVTILHPYAELPEMSIKDIKIIGASLGIAFSIKLINLAIALAT